MPINLAGTASIGCSQPLDPHGINPAALVTANTLLRMRTGLGGADIELFNVDTPQNDINYFQGKIFLLLSEMALCVA